MFTNFSAVQINRLAQRLSEAPFGRSAKVAAAAERFERLLVARIGADRAPKAAKAILTAPGFETAEGRLVADIDACEPDAPAEPAPLSVAPEPSMETAPTTDSEPAAAVAPIVEANEPNAEQAAAPSARGRRDADVDAKARQGELPLPPDFSAPTHARFRAKLAVQVDLAGKAVATGLRAIPINPVSSSPRALARYRDLAVLAIEARPGHS